LPRCHEHRRHRRHWPTISQLAPQRILVPSCGLITGLIDPDDALKLVDPTGYIHLADWAQRPARPIGGIMMRLFRLPRESVNGFIHARANILSAESAHGNSGLLAGAPPSLGLSATIKAIDGSLVPGFACCTLRLVRRLGLRLSYIVLRRAFPHR
jgi:hypothetical protein